MANRLKQILRHLGQALPADAHCPTDGQLLARFVATRDETAFAALVRRHGAMVLGVCRRLLRHEQAPLRDLRVRGRGACCARPSFPA